jgi:hypothetical protein
MIYNGGFETRYIQVAFFLAVDELGDRRGSRERESMQSLVIWIFRFDPQKVCTKLMHRAHVGQSNRKLEIGMLCLLNCNVDISWAPM